MEMCNTRSPLSKFHGSAHIWEACDACDPEMVHRSVSNIDNVLMFAFSMFLPCVFLGHWLSKEKLGSDCWVVCERNTLSSKIVMAWLKKKPTTIFQGNSYCEKDVSYKESRPKDLLENGFCFPFRESHWTATRTCACPSCLVWHQCHLFRALASLQI